MSDATVILGRDGMGEATEADFDAWVTFVCDKIDGATGLDVDVEVRHLGDVQSDHFAPRGTPNAETVESAIVDLWEQFCADPTAWPARVA
jgi:hypothetical protein